MNEITDRFHRIESIVNEVLDTPEELRADLIETRCGADPTLADEVRLLLNSCNEEEQLMATCRSEPPPAPSEPPERKQVGPYEIDRLLGRGGMGAVYLAHRADGHFEQKVAIKLIDRPFAADLFRERFRQERQILAGLQHPYIARLLDGGVTAEDELYLTMEYVDGVPIHRFAIERKLSQIQRIELFLRVCEAVQFAHQNFVVHRDLKPDNILVAADGTPRLLDFGTAKLLSPSPEGQESQLTREGYLSFTPQYASPEQVLGNAITTASDTYSLGVLLYLLLIDKPPYEFKEIATGEMLRAVCEETPRKPFADSNGKRLDADLEAILLKALRKEPQERYLTAERLADDLHAYLEGQPVVARRGTARYLAGKFIRRHRLALAAAAVVVATLVAGIVGIGWQASVANRERRIANEERRKAEARSADLRQLSNSLLSEFDDAIKQIPGSTGAQKLLVTSVLNHLDRVAKDAQGDRRTQLDLASAYTKLAELQGSAYGQNLGNTAGALSSIDKAIALTQPFAAAGSRDREAIHALASAQLARSGILTGTASVQEIIESTQKAVADFDRMMALPGVTKDEVFDAANAYIYLGDELGINSVSSLNDLPGALAAYRRCLELNSLTFRFDPKSIWAKQGQAVGEAKIAEIELQTDPAQALKDIDAGLQLLAGLSKADQDKLGIIQTQNMLQMTKTFALVELGRYSEANAITTQTMQSYRHLVATDPQDTFALSQLGSSLANAVYVYLVEADQSLGASASDRRRSLMAAEAVLPQEISVVSKLIKQSSAVDELEPFLADAQINLGSIQTILHRGGDSTQLVRSGLANWRELVKKNQNSSTVLDDAAQDFLFAEPATLKDTKLAVACAERAVMLSRRKLPTKLLTLAQAYRAAGQFEKSRAAAKEGLALLPAPQPGSVKPRIRRLLEIQAESRV